MALDKVDAAHARLLRDASLQLRFTVYKPPVQPAWLRDLIKWIVGAIPHLAIAFWAIVAAGALAIVVYLATDRGAAGRGKRVATSRLQLGMEDWTPTEPAARALLAEADDLASQGQFGEAVHILLRRSVEDIRQRRPHLIGPSTTSRDIASLPTLPEAARTAFRPIATLVEGSVFGGRTIDAAGFAACRGSYEAFALPVNWGGAA